MKWLFRPIHPSTLAAFRIIFGALMIWEAMRMWANHTREFPSWEFWTLYDSLEFVRSWTRPDPDTVFFVLTMAAVGFFLGLLTRLSAAVFAVVYAYQFLFDPTHFNNHYYLIALFSFWLIFVRSEAMWSVDSRLRPSLRRETIPWWHVGVFQFHLAIVYFFGGLAKLRGDWLRREPVHPWMKLQQDSFPLVGHWLAEKSTAYFVAYFGLVFDLCIPILLFYRKTRPYAIILAVLFHLTNTRLFDIGVFPWLGIGSLIVFVKPDMPARLANCFTGFVKRMLGIPPGASPSETPQPAASPITITTSQKVVAGLLICYFTIQALLPFRHFLYERDVEWSEEGKHFAWRMMLSYKETFVGLRVVDSKTGIHFEVDQAGALLHSHGLTRGKREVFLHEGQPMMVPEKLLSRRHRRGKGVWGNPRLLAQYARYLKREAEALGMHDPQVYADAVVALNGRPFQYIIDPDVDLASVKSPAFSTPSWIVPLKPNQPIGDYPMSLQELYDRVMPVIEAHHRKDSPR